MNEILETKTPVKNAYHLFPLLAPSPPLPFSINQFHVPDLPELIPRESLVCVGSFYRPCHFLSEEYELAVDLWQKLQKSLLMG